MPTQLIVESTDRDRSANQDPLSFTIYLPDSYRNVVQVELLDSLLPRFISQIRNSQNYLPFFVYLRIKELGGNFDSTNMKHTDCFTRFSMVSNNPTVHRLVGFDGDRRKNYPVPIARLDKLTIQFLGEDGSPLFVGYDLLPYEYKQAALPNSDGTTTTFTTSNHDLIDNSDYVVIDKVTYAVHTVPNSNTFTINSPYSYCDNNTCFNYTLSSKTNIGNIYDLSLTSLDNTKSSIKTGNSINIRFDNNSFVTEVLAISYIGNNIVLRIETTVNPTDGTTVELAKYTSNVQWNRSATSDSYISYTEINKENVDTVYTLEIETTYPGAYKNMLKENDFIRIKYSDGSEFITKINQTTNEIYYDNTNPKKIKIEVSLNSEPMFPISITRYGDAALQLKSSFLFSIATSTPNLDKNLIPQNVYR